MDICRSYLPYLNVIDLLLVIGGAAFFILLLQIFWFWLGKKQKNIMSRIVSIICFLIVYIVLYSLLARCLPYEWTRPMNRVGASIGLALLFGVAYSLFRITYATWEFIRKKPNWKDHMMQGVILLVVCGGIWLIVASINWLSLSHQYADHGPI